MQLFKKLFQNSNNISVDRGRMRIRRAGLTGITTLVVKGISTIAGLITIPLTAKYLGTERFGIWLILSTLLTWISFVDLGLVNSLTNALATCDGREDKQMAQEAVSSAFYVMLLISLVLLLLFLIIYPLIPWNRVFNISSLVASQELKTSVFVCFILFFIRLPLSISGRIYGAYQEGYFHQIWSVIGSLSSIISLMFAIHTQANLPFLIMACFGSLLIGDVFSAIHLFGFRRQWLKPEYKYFNWLQCKSLLKTGFQFWTTQISAILIFETDLIIVTQLFGAKAVASYGITLRLFSLVVYVLSSFTISLWPAYTEALARGDHTWINHTFKMSVFISFTWSFLIGTLLVIFSPQLVELLVSKEAIPNLGLLCAMLFTTVLNSVSQCVAMLVNGLGELKLQTIVAPISAISNIVLSLLLGNLIGVSGVALSTGICILLFSLGAVGTDIITKLKLRVKMEINEYS
ncbi:MATE family efflux transporter [Calothrix sp. PCC 7507]|uniref:MATE family efflux transporter n=1 Tax=Calothrix sp. PCC 7507 TaxID=99598 RepID=UPI00029F3F46|nr:MATE family efflux transporter [Calothrix sp. PCC 7507]AFY32518.1 multi antimicrobial extrusion protein MatE [Calothrix sp. PCC 7507]